MHTGRLVQLVRTPRLHRGGRPFESAIAHWQASRPAHLAALPNTVGTSLCRGERPGHPAGLHARLRGKRSGRTMSRMILDRRKFCGLLAAVPCRLCLEASSLSAAQGAGPFPDALAARRAADVDWILDRFGALEPAMDSADGRRRALNHARLLRGRPWVVAGDLGSVERATSAYITINTINGEQTARGYPAVVRLGWQSRSGSGPRQCARKCQCRPGPYYGRISRARAEFRSLMATWPWRIQGCSTGQYAPVWCWSRRSTTP